MEDDSVVLVETPSSLTGWLARRVQDPSFCDSCDVVVPLSKYDMGLKSMKELRKQLSLDLPRSHVLIRGERCLSVEDIIKESTYPRVCTQSALCTPLEWMLRDGFVAHEVGYAMRVNVCEKGYVSVNKRLGLASLKTAPLSCGVIDIHIRMDGNCVVVGLSFSENC